MGIKKVKISELPKNQSPSSVEVPGLDNTNENVSTELVALINTLSDAKVLNVLKHVGAYDASSDQFPSTGGSGTGGAILRGNLWNISVPGTLGGVSVGTRILIVALVDSPGQTASSWFISASEETTQSILQKIGDGSQIGSQYLPSYVDDVIEADDFDSLPETGEQGKIYVTIDDNASYRWSGSTYVLLSNGANETIQVLQSSSNITFDISNGINAILELSTDCEISFESLTEGCKGKVVIIQGDLDNTISIVPTPYVKDNGSGVVKVKNGFGAITILDYFYDGSKLFIENKYDYTTIPLANELNSVADNGSIIPLFSSISEAAYYDELLDVTLFAWEGWSNGTKYIYISSYNHSTRNFSPIVNVGIVALINDYHGVPCIVKDHQGYIHVFGGSHNTNLQHSVSDNPNDVSSFTLQNPIEGSYSYPHAINVSGTLYIFVRSDSVGYYGMSVIKSATLDLGLATWDTEVVLMNLNPVPTTSSTRAYIGSLKLVGQEIWGILCRYDNSDSNRRDVYFVKYDTATGSMKNFSETFETLPGSLPILRTDADNEYRLVTNSEAGTDIPIWGQDYLNRVNIFYSDGNDVDGFGIYHIYDTGNGWSNPVLVATTYQQYDTYAAIFKERGEIMLVYAKKFTKDQVYYYPYDGEPVFKIRDIHGFWTDEQKLVTGVDFPMGRFLAIHNAHKNAQLIFAEISDGVTDAYAGNKRIFIYGEDGFLARHLPPSNTALPTANGVISSGEIIVGTEGDWEGYPTPEFSYRWLSNEVPINGAIDPGLLITAELEGTTIELEVTGSNKFGQEIINTSGLSNSQWSSLKRIPGKVVYNAVPSFAYDGTRYIYSGANDKSNQFWRYDTHSNSWTRLADSPEEFLDYAFLVYTGDYIYVSKGAYSGVFMRYIIASDSWEYRTTAPYTLRTGQHGVWDGGNQIFIQQGDNMTIYIYRIIEDDWDFSTIAQAPVSMFRGYLAYDGTDNLYMFRGLNVPDFYKYTFSTNTWTKMTDCPINAGQGCCMVMIGSYIYAIPGQGSSKLYIYDTTLNSWTELSDAPEAVNYGGAMATDGTFLYIRRGEGKLDFWRYRI